MQHCFCYSFYAYQAVEKRDAVIFQRQYIGVIMTYIQSVVETFAHVLPLA